MEEGTAVGEGFGRVSSAVSAAVKEKLELVRSFDELRAGMIVVVKPCAWDCGGAHRGIIATWVQLKPTLAREGLVEQRSGWGVLPAPPCSSIPTLITPDGIVRGNVYRVIDPGLEASESTPQRTGKPKTVRA